MRSCERNSSMSSMHSMPMRSQLPNVINLPWLLDDTERIRPQLKGPSCSGGICSPFCRALISKHGHGRRVTGPLVKLSKKHHGQEVMKGAELKVVASKPTITRRLE